MGAIDLTYSARPIDITRGLVPIRSTFDQLSSVAAAQIILQTSVLSAEFVMHFTHYRMFADPGAGQNINGASLQITDENNNNLLRINGTGGLAADVNFNAADQVDVWVLPGEKLRAQFDFNAGVAANLAFISLHGIRIPFANFQRGTM